MKFTVLLSLYYKEVAPFLQECLNSILNNNLLPDQVVIVYDGPIGNDLESVVDIASRKLPIEIIRLQKNVGLGDALNRGLQYCRNEIVLRMDTDDICDVNRFDKQINYFLSHPEVALLGGAIEEYDENMEVSLGKRFSASDHQEILNYAKKRNPFNHMTVAFRKSIIESVGGYKHHFLMEDYNLWLRVLASGHRTHNLEDVLVKVRAGDGMIFRRKGVRYIQSEFKLAVLKYNLGLDSFWSASVCSMMRIFPRLLPASLLKKVYTYLRH
ncbi:UNVERIFIED_ORG: glycosyltransferase involved in cell wall biosynthesis [Lelliottia amnigena]|jgi:glycosyltransferase involved in cell wall biosynthesis|nr:glycosyltransferase involved in cell wall biosynthesis [Lelliottia amnigena]